MNLQQLSRRRFMVTFGGLLLTSSISACAWRFNKPITIAAHVWPGYEPMFLAQRENWLDTQQVRLMQTASATESVQALAAGSIDGAALTLDETLKARAAGIPLSVVLVFNISAGADMLLVNANIKSLADLKGRRIGFEQSSVGELFLAEVLQTAGLEKSEVKLVALTVDQQVESWTHQRIEAVVSYEPVASQLQALGAFKLFDSRLIPNTIVDVLAIRSDILDYRHSSAIRHLINAHFRALEHINQNSQDASYRMATHLGLPADEVLPAFKGLVLPNAANNYRLFAGASPTLLANARHLSNTMVKNALLTQHDRLDGLIRADFLPTDFQNN
ncbi:MAG: ABC transporter substrate-binding protein [Methylophilaceae bacterium]